MDDHFRYGRAFLLFSFFGWLVTVPVASAKSCGAVSVISGNSCHKLKLKFDLVGCGDASFERETQIECRERSASVVLKTDLFRYNSELFSTVSPSGRVTWEVIGHLAQSELDQVADLGAPLLFTKPVVKSKKSAKIHKTPIVLPPPVSLNEDEDKEKNKDEILAETGENSKGGRNLASLDSASSVSASRPGTLPAGLTFSLLLDGYYSYNLNQPLPPVLPAPNLLTSPSTPIRAYDFYHNNLGLSLLEVTVKQTYREIGFTVDLDFGPAADFNAAKQGASLSGGPTLGAVDAVSKTLGQTFVTYRPFWAPHLIIDFGKMATHLGYEGWKSKDNWQYSRSTSFLFGLPRWHSGLHLGYSLLPGTLVLSTYLYNSWNSIIDNNAGKTLGAQVKWTPAGDFTLVYNYISGPEQTGNETNLKSVHEAYIAWNTGGGVSLALETLYGHEDGAVLLDALIANADWMGAYFATRFSFFPGFFVSPRFEIYRDTSGANLGGDSQTLYGLTLTTSYKVGEGLETRLEFREDASSYGRRFITGPGLSNNQTTLTLGVIYTMD